MIFVLSLTRDIRFQTLCMDAKIRAFFAAAMRRGELTGRNSATGSPRRSITITPPSAASRTNFDVLMCRSRTDVVLMCYIVAPDLLRKAEAAPRYDSVSIDQARYQQGVGKSHSCDLGRWLPALDAFRMFTAEFSLPIGVLSTLSGVRMGAGG